MKINEQTMKTEKEEETKNNEHRAKYKVLALRILSLAESRALCTLSFATNQREYYFVAFRALFFATSQREYNMFSNLS